MPHQRIMKREFTELGFPEEEEKKASGVIT
jgi:hypothetical protein